MMHFFMSFFMATVMMTGGGPSSAPPAAPAQAESGSEAEPQGIATVVEIKGEVRALAKGTGAQRTLKDGDAIYLDETISTLAGASIQFEVADESLFTLSENTTVRMDLFDLDEEKKDGHLAANVTKGIFRFVSGKVAKVKPENVNIEVPSGTIGIRGTVVLGEIEGEKCLVSLEAEEGSKIQHRIIFSGMVQGQKQEVEITEPGFATVIEKRGMAPRPVFQLPQENRDRFQERLAAPRFLPRDAQGRPQMNPNVRDPQKFPGPMRKRDDRQNNPGGPNPPGGPGGGPGGSPDGSPGNGTGNARGIQPGSGVGRLGLPSAGLETEGFGRNSGKPGNDGAFGPKKSAPSGQLFMNGRPIPSADGRNNPGVMNPPQKPGGLQVQHPAGKLKAGGPGPAQKPQAGMPRNQNPQNQNRPAPPPPGNKK